jgi:hypothetical protein
LFEVTKKWLLQEGCVMSIVKTRGLPRSDRPAEIEGSIRDLVRRESGVIRQSEDISEQATADLSSLVYRVSGESAREIDHLIDGLKHLRQKLDDDGRRVQREIVEYASLSQSVIQLTKIVSEGMTHVKKVPDAPSISDQALNSADVSVDEQN